MVTLKPALTHCLQYSAVTVFTSFSENLTCEKNDFLYFFEKNYNVLKIKYIFAPKTK